MHHSQARGLPRRARPPQGTGILRVANHLSAAARAAIGGRLGVASLDAPPSERCASQRVLRLEGVRAWDGASLPQRAFLSTKE